MKQQLLAALITPLAFFSQVGQGATQNEADLVFKNAYVYTVDKQRSVQEAVAIRGNRIVAVGESREIEELIGPGTDVRDLAGKMLMPGLHDAHIHALGVIEPGPETCDLEFEALTLDELHSFVKGCLEEYPRDKGEWLPVVSWMPNNDPSKKFATVRAALDAVSLDHPIILWGYDGHLGAANSAAFSRAKNPETGKVVGLNAVSLKSTFAVYQEHVGLDSQGELSGEIHETARFLLRTEMMEDILGGLNSPSKLMPAVAQKLAANGITSIQDARVTEPVLEHYRWLEESGEMSFRVRAALFQQTPGSILASSVDTIPAYIARFQSLRAQNQHLKYVKPEAVKLYADGVIVGDPTASPAKLPSAAMIEGYQQPIFSVMGEGDDIELEVIGYVDLESAECVAVREAPNDYLQPQAITKFNESFGFYPQQCDKNYGVLEHADEFIHGFVQQATAAAFHVHVHASSDRGIRVSLDAFEAAKSLADDLGLTQSMAHVDIATPEDQKRFGELRVDPVFTYSWMSPSDYMQLSVPFIDQVKNMDDINNPNHYSVKNLFAVNSIAEFGANIVWGSDTPVGFRDPMPFLNMQVALTRSMGGEVLNEVERINIHQAIASFTINAAKLLSQNSELGSIEVGKIADLIVLNQNVVALAEQGQAQDIFATHVDLTVFDGKVVYERTWFRAVKDYLMDLVFKYLILT